jgi:hypothetical protein
MKTNDKIFHSLKKKKEFKKNVHRTKVESLSF